MATMQKVGKHCTTNRYDSENDRGSIIYHNTEVVKFDHEKIVLNSGGWRTVTTKTRMNQAANQYNLGYYVYQEKKAWYVSHHGEVSEFQDGMILYR